MFIRLVVKPNRFCQDKGWATGLLNRVKCTVVGVLTPSNLLFNTSRVSLETYQTRTDVSGHRKQNVDRGRARLGDTVSGGKSGVLPSSYVFSVFWKRVQQQRRTSLMIKKGEVWEREREEGGSGQSRMNRIESL